MDIIALLLKEFEQEAVITRKMLERIPEDKWDWKPHEKSMTIKQLTVHLAEIPAWVTMGFNTEGMDFAQGYHPTQVETKKELLELFEKSYQSGKESLQKATEKDLLPMWTMRTGDKIHMSITKYELVRHAFSQMTHHRAQLGVYLRLLNIPIPGSYGPSADEMAF
jgi:uncharacterized damage-inducible protein DinB